VACKGPRVETVSAPPGPICSQNFPSGLSRHYASRTSDPRPAREAISARRRLFALAAWPKSRVLECGTVTTTRGFLTNAGLMRHKTRDNSLFRLLRLRLSFCNDISGESLELDTKASERRCRNSLLSVRWPGWDRVSRPDSSTHRGYNDEKSFP
jgi:hypothetical protein